MGELHLEVIKHRLLRDFNLNVRVHKPRVSYRETVEQPGEVDRQMPPAAGRANAVRRSEVPRRAAARRQTGAGSFTNWYVDDSCHAERHSVDRFAR